MELPTSTYRTSSCRRFASAHRVPKPEQGYWNRKHAGQKVIRWVSRGSFLMVEPHRFGRQQVRMPVYAATTVILAVPGEVTRFRIDMSTSWPRAVRKTIRRSTEKPSSL